MSEKKFHIEEGSVQETLILPLYGRKLYMDLYPDLLPDQDGKDLIESIDYDFSKKYPNGGKGLSARIGAIEYGLRVRAAAEEMKKYLSDHPNAAVVNMGCGLDTTHRMADNGTCHVYCIDFPDVIELRTELLPPKENETYIACDLNDASWMDQIDFKEENGAFFYALGVFFYFKKEEVKKLFDSMAGRFPGGRIAFDATNAKGLKMMLKEFLQKSGMTVDAYFSLENPEEELKTYSSHISKVTHYGLFEGHFPLDKRYGKLINWMGRSMGDKKNMSQFNVIEFEK